jgi:hypothetical protein
MDSEVGRASIQKFKQTIDGSDDGTDVLDCSCA